MNPSYIERALKESMSSLPPNFRFGDDWESIRLPEGYEKPPKEEFEAKLQELIDAQPLKDLRAERDRRLQAVDWVDDPSRP